MKNILSFFLAAICITILNPYQIDVAMAEGNDDLIFNQVSTLRTDTSRHRNLAPLPPFSLQVLRDIPNIKELEIGFPTDMPALISHELQNAMILGSPVDEGRISALLTWKNLSVDQRSLRIPVSGGLKAGDSILIQGISMKVHEYLQRTFRASLRYSPQGTDEKIILLSGFGVFLQIRSDNIATPGILESSFRSRNHSPEPPRELRVSKNRDESIQINWKKNADHDLSAYTVQVINDLTNISVFEERMPKDATFVNVGNLESEKTYRLFFAVEDSSGLRSTDEMAFTTASLDLTPEEDLPPAPEPEVPVEPTSPEEPESLEFQKEPKFTEDETAPEAQKEETGFVLPTNIQDITSSEDLIKEALLKVQPELPMSGFLGSAPVKAEFLNILTGEGKFSALLKGTSRRRLLIQSKRLVRRLADLDESDLTNADVAKMLTYLYRYEKIKNARLVKRIPVSPTASREEQSHRRYVYNLQKKGMITPEITEKIFYGLGKIRTEDFYLMMYYTLKRLEDTSGNN
ncbi:MAG: fibronectin type III domain-containing protein [Candidatus Gracilibacteria bacterium]|nr:fibronectin type III domain-containing protein [Candidatus Gracilibacteria bacterium]